MTSNVSPAGLYFSCNFQQSFYKERKKVMHSFANHVRVNRQSAETQYPAAEKITVSRKIS